jgi:heat shock protein HslJ
MNRFFRYMPISRMLSALLAVGLLLLTACGPIVSGSGQNPLVGTLWNLVGYGQPGALTPPVEDSQATLNIDATNMAGSTGCNHYSAAYTMNGQSLTVPEPGPTSTMMACAEPLMQQEAAFLSLLTTATSYTVAGDTLTLTSPNGVLVFEVARPLALEGTEWHLSGIVENDAVASFAVDQEITLTLTDGQAAGFAGCNTYSGPYTLSGASLTFGALGSTKMACEGDRGTRETAFLNALTQIATHKIERSQLTLLDSAGKPVVMLVAAE